MSLLAGHLNGLLCFGVIFSLFVPYPTPFSGISSGGNKKRKKFNKSKEPIQMDQ
jgi:hypothetical protein